jgi:hypothetical protein
VEFGLTTGQIMRALTQKPLEWDLELLHIDSSNGEVWSIAKCFITYMVTSEVDMPTDAEVEEFKQNLAAKSGYNVNSAAEAMQQLKQYGQGQYL